jgi:hypothetical protein
MSDLPDDDTTIAELFSRDPLKLSEQDLDQIIHRLRAQRKKFVQGNLTIGKPEAKKSAAQKKREAVASALGDDAPSLSDLGL